MRPDPDLPDLVDRAWRARASGQGAQYGHNDDGAR